MIYEETVVLTGPFDEALDKVKKAFAAEGFGTLTEIDMQATLKKKVDKDMEQYVILGVCNPHLASRAIDVVTQIGVLLPCNVVVRKSDDDIVVEVMDPGLMATMTGSPELKPIADEAREMVNDALARLNVTNRTSLLD